MRASKGNTMQAVFGSIGFADLKGLAERVLDKQQRRREALARFGSEQAVFAENVQERFCVDALALVPVTTKGWLARVRPSPGQCRLCPAPGHGPPYPGRLPV